MTWEAQVITPAGLMGDLLDLYKEGLAGGLSTGWLSVDDHYTVVPGFWTLVTGYPGSGKSEWVDALCLNLARLHNWRFVYYSPENQPHQLHLAKLMEKHMGKPFFDGPTERLSIDDMAEANYWLAQRFAFIQQKEGPRSVQDVLDICWSWIHESGKDNPAGIIIDPWNELEHKQPSHMTETQYISYTLSVIRQFARDHNCHIWIIAHPTKIQKDKDAKRPIPTLSDVSGGAHWWNKADFGIVVHRDQTQGSNETQIHVQKVRFKHMGKQGMVTLRWDRVTGQYTEPLIQMKPLSQYRREAAPL
jgi:twinkle protein